ncbi:hypothetical protein INR49_005436 [Caranx melampygus]|nr:hypothetical protein INR49_005436 [Caranx melampygus]
MAALSAMPQSGLTGLTTPPAPSSSLPSSSHDLLTSTQPKQQLPQFSAAFGHQLASHSGIPKDVQPSHSSTAPPAGFPYLVKSSSGSALKFCVTEMDEEENTRSAARFLKHRCLG